MRATRTPAPRRAGTQNKALSAQFALLALELAALDPEKLAEIGEELLRDSKPFVKNEQAAR